MKKLLILAIVLRLLVAAFYFHPDIKTYNFQASFLRKGVVNIYSYLVDNKKTLPLKDDFVYFPLTYFVVGGYQIIASPTLGPNFVSWLANASGNSAVRDPNIFRYLIVLKLPYLIIDIGIAYLLLRYFTNDPEKGKKAFIIWLFNPFTIILFYVFSNIDIIPVALGLVSLLMVKKDRLALASFILAVASGFKLYPLLFIPFLVLYAKTVKERLIIIGVFTATFLVITLPFMSGAFVQSALVSGLTTRIFSPSFSLGFNESNIFGLTGTTALFFFAYLIDKKINLLFYWTTILLIIFSFSHFHIQWLAWLAPFVVILFVEKPRLGSTILFLAVCAFLIPPLYEDRFMSVDLLRVYSTLYDLAPTPFTFIQKFYDPYNLQSIFHSLFAGGSTLLIYKLYKEKV